MSNNSRFNELAKAKIQDDRNLVISEFKFDGKDKGFTIAQQLDVKNSNGKLMSIFLKESIHIDDIDGLYALRDALNLAIKKVNEKLNDDNFWDEE